MVEGQSSGKLTFQKSARAWRLDLGGLDAFDGDVPQAGKNTMKAKPVVHQSTEPMSETLTSRIAEPVLREAAEADEL